MVEGEEGLKQLLIIWTKQVVEVTEVLGKTLYCPNASYRSFSGLKIQALSSLLQDRAEVMVQARVGQLTAHLLELLLTPLKVGGSLLQLMRLLIQESDSFLQLAFPCGLCVMLIDKTLLHTFQCLALLLNEGLV